MTKKEKIFINHVKFECHSYGIKCDLRDTEFVKLENLSDVSGYFDSEEPVLVCSMKRKDFIEILAHEYGHLTQWSEGFHLWEETGVSLGILDEWLAGKEVPDILYHIANCRDLELDNEKRTVKIIKKFDLPVDLKKYVKKANAYVLFYNYLAYSRRWTDPSNSPYKNKRILAAMSDRFNMKYDVLLDKYRKIFEEEGI